MRLIVNKPPEPRTETERTAAAIVAAGVKRRSRPGPAPLPANDIGNAIVLVGRKVRGTIAQADAYWLADFIAGRKATRELLRPVQ